MSKINRTWEGTNPNIKAVSDEVQRRYPHKLLEGKRAYERQEHLVSIGASKTLNSTHLDGEGVDLAPDPIEWPDEKAMKRVLAQIDNDAELKKYIKTLARFYYFGGYFLATADAMGNPMDWGGDWDGDRDIFDQNFDDLVHFQNRKRGK